MSDPSSPLPQDYYSASVSSRYGYFAKVLRPGMTADQIRTAIVDLQNSSGGPFNQPFVTSLNDAQINEFIQKYEIVASSADNVPAAWSGLDVVVLRSRQSEELTISIGGVGPYDLDLVEGKKLLEQTEVYGFDMSEFTVLKSIVDPILTTYSSDVINIFGHSKGAQCPSSEHLAQIAA